MSEALMALVAFLVVAAFACGMWRADRMSQQMWLEHGYCPTCDRLTTDQEADRSAALTEDPS